MRHAQAKHLTRKGEDFSGKTPPNRGVERNRRNRPGRAERIAYERAHVALERQRRHARDPV